MVTRAAARTATRGVAAASILGALSPDVDFVLMPAGWDVYLRAHEIGTHSIPGLIVTGLGSAVLVRLAVRGSRFATLAGAAIAGAGSHVVADIVSGARLRPAWPVADVITSLPLVSMADPWLMAILATGALAMWWSAARRRAVARGTLVALALFLGMKGLLLASALRTFDPPHGAGSEPIVEARWASLTEWYLFDRTAGAVRQWKLDARGRDPELLLSWPVGPDTPLVRASRRLDTVRNFLSVHSLGFAVEQPAAGRRRAVLWSDIRFCSRPPRAGGPIACALWFGGILEPDGRPVRQRVHVGSWVQERPAPEREAPPPSPSP